LVGEQSYAAVVDLLAGYVEPVEQFFVDVLVVDKENPAATLARRDLIQSLHDLLTGCFDLRELAGQATKRGS
jgi:glycyl-tRNA synthetase beta subunit